MTKIDISPSPFYSFACNFCYFSPRPFLNFIEAFFIKDQPLPPLFALLQILYKIYIHPHPHPSKFLYNLFIYIFLLESYFKKSGWSVLFYFILEMGDIGERGVGVRSFKSVRN